MRVQNLEEARRMLARLGEELPKAAQRSKARMVYKLWEGERVEAMADFHRPTQYSIKSILYEAKESTAYRVYIKDQELSQGADETHYLGVQTLGGTRNRLRKSERIWQSRGLMPSGRVWVPTQYTKLDVNGNVPSALISAILNVNGRRSDKYFFMGQPGQERGVWAKQNTGQWLPILLFVTPRQYQERYDFYGRADREVSASLVDIMDEEILKALRDAN